jgi:foldase protein PrsA
MAAIESVDGVLATVNDQEIVWADFEPELRQMVHSVSQQYSVDWNQADNVALLGTLQDQVLQTVMNRTLLRQLAAEEGIEVSEADLQARLDQEQEEIMASGLYASWEDFKGQAGLSEDYFERLVLDSELIERLGQELAPNSETEQVHARHILVADKETGQEVLDRLDEGEDWAALAAELSMDTSNKDDAGDLGWFPRGVMVSEFEEAAFALEPGTISDLVETDFGVHIIQVLDKGMRKMDEQTYAMAKQQAFESWFTEKRADAEMAVAVEFDAQE